MNSVQFLAAISLKMCLAAVGTFNKTMTLREIKIIHLYIHTFIHNALGIWMHLNKPKKWFIFVYIVYAHYLIIHFVTYDFYLSQYEIKSQKVLFTFVALMEISGEIELLKFRLQLLRELCPTTPLNLMDSICFLFFSVFKLFFLVNVCLRCSGF